MKPAIKFGLILGVAVEIWIYFMGLLGRHRDPVMLNFFWLVILIQIGVLIWGLRITARDNSYGQQVGAGTLMSAVGGVIIFLGSLLFTAVVFPHYFEDLRVATEEMMKQRGMSESEISAQMEAMASTQTSFMQALTGFLGTLITGVLASLVIAVFARKKGEAEQPAA